MVLSDANEVYITEILTAYELNDYVDSVITNKGYWEDGHDGTPILRIKPYHHNSSCRLCPENLCKGSVLRCVYMYVSLSAYTYIYIYIYYFNAYVCASVLCCK